MKSAQLFGPRDLRVVEVERPRPRAGEVLVQVMFCSPYGTDIGVYLNRDGRYVASYPVGIGADFSGIVAELGQGVDTVDVGDRVSALSLDHCGTCENCGQGRTNLCLHPEFQQMVRQTACEEYTLVRACKLARIPDSVSFDDAAMLAGPVDALNGFTQLGLTAGDEVMIIGVGAMGLTAIAMARALELVPVAVGGTGKRTEIARAMGASAVHGIPHHGFDIAAHVLERSGPAAAILETTASAWGLEQSFRLAAPGGGIALTGGPDLPATAWTIVERELRLFGVRAGAGQVKALELLAVGRLNLSGAVTHRFDLDETGKALALLASEAARDVGRVIIRVGGGQGTATGPADPRGIEEDARP